jgi:protein tyrosine/serine phosphatase
MRASVSTDQTAEVVVAFDAVSARRNVLAAVLALVILPFTPTYPVLAQDTRLSVSSIRIDNFGQVNPTYFRGAQPKGADFANLTSLGIKTLISLTSDDSLANERALVEQAGLKFVKIPMSTRVAPTADELSQFMTVVTDPANQPVYVHCVGGRHRTGVMTAAYRMAHDGWSAEQAFKEMKQYKFGLDFLHPEFKQFVFEFAAQLATAGAVGPGAGNSR